MIDMRGLLLFMIVFLMAGYSSYEDTQKLTRKSRCVSYSFDDSCVTINFGWEPGYDTLNACEIIGGSYIYPSPLKIKAKYNGANATFTLYEDDGVSTKNEKGEYCTIEMKWDNTTRTFTIGAAKGSYEGMPKERVFHVALSEHESIDVKYNGGKKSIKLKL